MPTMPPAVGFSVPVSVPEVLTRPPDAAVKVPGLTPPPFNSSVPLLALTVPALLNTTLLKVEVVSATLLFTMPPAWLLKTGAAPPKRNQLELFCALKTPPLLLVNTGPLLQNTGPAFCCHVTVPLLLMAPGPLKK